MEAAWFYGKGRPSRQRGNEMHAPRKQKAAADPGIHSSATQHLEWRTQAVRTLEKCRLELYQSPHDVTW